ncbi:GNAT family N-acetyltransferase [Salipiger sp. PrR002]|uniref:GNAT family N-acetyltransferase n=1 Tax=Salipiger sp. PrR002 TaxID=2706489 RepID=UPI0013B69744|nr:GNAT family N-acetyltransferase [Salipiger sp. PrR002]NDV97733.1 GNAT family N-acetyltransferase [Salipiger sp. PrR002]NDW55224.1 GNAT family N-acetyltransferase [Salipiger sp. PrR004]
MSDVTTGVEIRALGLAEAQSHLAALAEVLQACVADGASVGFVMPFSLAEAEGFWRGLLPEVGTGGRLLFGGFLEGRLVGTGSLVPAGMPNQTHRAEVSKMLVHPAFRRRGIARALMLALLERSKQMGRDLVTLDTRSGDAAQHLYSSCGFLPAGEIPEYALAPEGGARRDATLFMYRLG